MKGHPMIRKMLLWALLALACALGGTAASAYQPHHAQTRVATANHAPLDAVKNVKIEASGPAQALDQHTALSPNLQAQVVEGMMQRGFWARGPPSDLHPVANDSDGTQAKGLALAAQSQATGLSIAGPIQNLKPGSLIRWKAALAGVRNGTSSATMAYLGTSLLLGAYAGDGVNNLVRVRAPNVRVANKFVTAGIPATSQSFYGNGYYLSAVGNTLDYFDARVTTTGGWVPNSSIGFSAGGYGARGSSAGTISFAFTGAADTLTVYEIQTNAFATGVYSLDIDGTTTVSAGQTTTLAANSIKKVTLTFPAIGAGAHTLHINWVSGTPAIMGASLTLSTAPSVQMINMAAGGSTAGNWNGSGTAGAAYVVSNVINPDLSIFEMGANDWLGAVDVPTYVAAITNTLTALRTGGVSQSDVICMTPFPTAISNTPKATQQIYVDAFIGVCKKLGLPYIDAWRKIGSWESKNVVGYPSGTQDTVHPNARGAWDYPNLIFNALMSIDQVGLNTLPPWWQNGRINPTYRARESAMAG